MTDPNPAKFNKLVTLLRELFQLDQPDLDFGIYRIMHAKAGEVTQFLERELLPQVKDAFASYQSADSAELQKTLAEREAQYQADGVDPSTVPGIQKLREQLKGAVDIGALENETYDHLHSFFRRYYSEGDFLAKRVYKPGVYAIPYEGEEVTLHWANKDQYYIKTSEYLRDYAFRLRPEAHEGEDPMRVHFRLVDAAEGEHGNIKASEDNKRVFVLAPADFIALQGGELEIRFEYHPATLDDWAAQQREGKKKPPTQKDLLELAETRIKAADGAFADWLAELARPHTKADGEAADYSRLAAHLRRYSARNTFDYFIHKDLGGFLRRELDFYIKNEVMHLDDVESDTVPKVEQYLSKIKVIRRIAGKIIDFLAQLENFQKKLWLKKKFVVGSDWLVAMSQVPDPLLPEVCVNTAQLQEWKVLHSLHELPADVTLPAYSEPLTPAYLRAHPTLMLDTGHFDAKFVARLIEGADQLDEMAGGVLVHSENFQALSLMQSRYREEVHCIYIDPPYNTDASAIAYKNDYKDSSWLSLMHERVILGQEMLISSGSSCIAIDDVEYSKLRELLSYEFGKNALLGVAAVRSNPAGRSTANGLSEAHEYAIFVAASSESKIGRLPRNERQTSRYGEEDADGKFEWVNFRKHGGLEATRKARPKMFYPIYAKGDAIRLPIMEWNATQNAWDVLEECLLGEVPVWPVTDDGVELRWKWGAESVKENLTSFCSRPDQSGNTGVYLKARMNADGMLPLSWWDDKRYSATEHGTNLLKKMFGSISEFAFPKSLPLVMDCLRALNAGEGALVLDYFGGSGTTGHAVVELNRLDNAARKFVLVEAGGHFDAVLTPRLKKVSFCPEWKGGKPERRASATEAERSPRLIKVLRLESYEDTLNNLALQRSAQQQGVLELGAAQGADGLREQYLLRYQLDVESKGSQSLLNVGAFADPTAYKLVVKTPGSDESREVNVDLLETFNWLLGLTVQHITAPRSFNAVFRRDGQGRLQLDGRLRQDAEGPWWFRTVTGTTPEGRKTLVVWRKLTGNAEQDNLVLDTWFKDKQAYSVRGSEFDLIYVNGDNTLENLRVDPETWKVRLIEEDFQRLMFDGTDA